MCDPIEYPSLESSFKYVREVQEYRNRVGILREAKRQQSQCIPGTAHWEKCEAIIQTFDKYLL